MQRLKGNCGISVREFPLFLPLASPHSLLWACFWLIGCHVLAIRRTQWRWGTPVHIPYHKCLSCSLLISCILIKESEWIIFFLPDLANWVVWEMEVGIRASFWIIELWRSFTTFFSCSSWIKLLSIHSLTGKHITRKKKAAFSQLLAPNYQHRN